MLRGTYPFSTGFPQLGTDLHRAFFDPDWEPMVTCKTPGAGKDILETSANNFYAGGVTSAVRASRASIAARAAAGSMRLAAKPSSALYQSWFPGIA